MIEFFGLILIITISVSCNSLRNESSKPKIAFSFAEGATKDRLTYKNSEWNSMIRKQLNHNQVLAIWFVAVKSMDSEKGKQLLQKWDGEGHIIANHTYNHFNYNETLMTFERFVEDILKCDSLILGYENFTRILRFPYLKAGNTIDKRDNINTYLK